MEDDAADVDEDDDDGGEQKGYNDGRQEPRQPQAVLRVYILH